MGQMTSSTRGKMGPARGDNGKNEGAAKTPIRGKNAQRRRGRADSRQMLKQLRKGKCEGKDLRKPGRADRGKLQKKNDHLSTSNPDPRKIKKLGGLSRNQSTGRRRR